MQTTNSQTIDSLELSKMFHEIKNPLTLINSSLQLIQDEHPEVTDFRFWNQTMEDLRKLRLLLDELSSFQKGDLLHITKINLFDFTEDILESISGFLLESATPLDFESALTDLDFYADDVKLRQAIINLLKNAAESSAPGSPILLRIYEKDQWLHISVADKGCGMNEEQLSKIFQPFHTTKSYGTGLGLPIVKKIIESHRGKLVLQSKEGAGTTVQISLPLS